MENKKPKAVATLTPEQLARFNAWQREEDTISESSRAAMSALMFSIRADKKKSLDESRAMWKEFEKTHGLNPNGCYGVNIETGEVTLHEHGSPFLMIAPQENGEKLH